MASLDDLVTVCKNGVIAVNTLVTTLSDFEKIYASFVGTETSIGINANQLLVTGSGRLVTISIITAASGGTVHDVSNIVDADTSNAIAAIPNAVGIMNVNFPFTNGLVVKPAAGSVLSISYSTD